MRRALAFPAAVVLTLALPAAAFAAAQPTPDRTFHPDEEFKLVPWIPLHLGPLDFSINKAVAYLWLGTVLTILLGLFLMRFRLGVRPGRRQTVGEMVYEIAQTQIAEQGLPTKAIGIWFPYVASLFLFILVLNFVSFIPLPISDKTFHLFGFGIPTWGLYAATSQISVTLMLAVLSVLFTHVEGVRYNGAFGHLKGMMPSGLPPLSVKTALPLFGMAVLEGISQAFRIVSLSVRLFANMLAGHMLILIFIGIMFVLGTAAAGAVTIPIATVFYVFEVIIVVTIQAFIFAALTAIYIGSAIEPSH